MGNAVPAKSPIARTEARDGSQEQRGAMQFQENRPTTDTKYDSRYLPITKPSAHQSVPRTPQGFPCFRRTKTEGGIGNAVPVKSAKHTYHGWRKTDLSSEG